MSDKATVSAEPALRRGTVLLEPQAGAPAVIDTGWQPASTLPPRAAVTSLAWALAGGTVLLATWVAVSAVGLVLDAHAQAPWFGVAIGAAFAAGAAMLGWAGWAELRAYRGLAKVDRLRALLADGAGPVGPARAAALDWVARLGTIVPDAAGLRRAVAGAESVAELQGVLRAALAGPLEQATGEAGRRAALEAGALVALCPHPALDGLLAGLRGLRLMREVATLHGVRPGLMASLALGRRVLVTAAATAGTELLSQALADQLLQRLPGLSHLAAAIPGATVAAVRLYRLAGVTGAACSPLPRRDG